MKQELILILDFGGQYTQLIARRVRECHVYSEVVPWTISLSDLLARKPAGVILSGGPSTVQDPSAPMIDPALYEAGIPILGICYGMQMTAHLLGGTVERAKEREYGRVTVRMTDRSGLFGGMKEASSCWMSHTWQIASCPPGFRVIAETDNCPVAAMVNEERKICGVQFHPEVTHTEEGGMLIRNFLFRYCGCSGSWTMNAFADTAVRQIRETVGETGTVLLALSGGVDSSVVAALIHRAIGKRLTCVFVDHGLLRKGESGQVCHVFSHLFPVRFIRADASRRFFDDLKGVTEPEEKRHIIGRDFIEVFKQEAAALGKMDYFAQGTIYPDVIESGQATNAAVIKSHHNVGGLPKELGFTELIEPFIGEVTPEKAEIVRESDAIFREEIAAAGLDRHVNQYFTVLTGIQSVGVMGDERTYDYTIALRAVTTDDFMTADWARLPYDLIARVSARIVNEVPHASRVVLDVTTKPPASIEWE